MPKAKKLHSKGKPTSLQKQTNLEDVAEADDNTRQFQLELCWCIQQLEKFMNEKKTKGNKKFESEFEFEKQMQETWKVLTVLKNNNQPLIRKRQLMRTHFGDYRAKMAAEEKKLAKSLASKMKITESTDQPKATFVRKSTFLSTGTDSFRFNFKLGPEESHQSNSNTAENVDNSKEEVGNISAEKNDTGNNSAEKDNTGNTNSLNVTGNTGEDKTTDNAGSQKQFKFTFTSSEFKFNFTPEPSNS